MNSKSSITGPVMVTALIVLALTGVFVAFQSRKPIGVVRPESREHFCGSVGSCPLV